MGQRSLARRSKVRSKPFAFTAKFSVLFLAAFLVFSGFSPPKAPADARFSIFVYGSVTDMISGYPIAGAIVSFPERGISVKTDAKGTLPLTEIELEPSVKTIKMAIEAKGYRGESSEVKVFPGARVQVTSRLVSIGYPGRVVLSREVVSSSGLSATGTETDAASSGSGNRSLSSIAAAAGADLLGNLGSIQGSFSAQALSAAGIPQSIRVYRVNLGRVDVVPFNFYVKHVLPSEWYGSWPMESLKAGAMGVKTYAWYWIAKGGKWPSLGADVKDTVADQVYNPNYSYPATDAAVDATWNYKMTRGGTLFESHYCAGSYGPGYEPGYEGWMTQWGTKYWADQGKDWQWILHYYYDPYGTISIDLVKKAASDFNGDGLSDAVAAYNYGGGTTGIWVFLSNGQTMRPSLWWKSKPGFFDANRAKWVSGDFNGDGYSDVAALYDYGGTKTGIWLFTSNRGGFAQPKLIFRSDYWSAGQTKLASGDFDGDGKDELLAFYGYGGTSIGVWLFDGIGEGSTYPRLVFFSGYWDWSKTTLVPGDFDGNGASDVGAIYNYGGSSTGFWIFPFSVGGKMSYPFNAYFTPYWAASSASYLSGDADGDGKDDIIAPYNYGRANMGIWFLKSTGSAFAPKLAYSSPYWDCSRSTFLAGDFTGDGIGDAAAVYDYGGAKTGIWLFPFGGSTISTAKMLYSTPSWVDSLATWIRSH